jgi:hypothetical protein
MSLCWPADIAILCTWIWHPDLKQLDITRYPHRFPQQLDTLVICTRLSSQGQKASNWTLQLSAQEFPSNWTFQLSAQEILCPYPRRQRVTPTLRIGLRSLVDLAYEAMPSESKIPNSLGRNLCARVTGSRLQEEAGQIKIP